MDATSVACLTCRFAIMMRMDPQSLQKIRVCKRMPPTAVAMIHQGQLAVRSLWPIVRDEDNCFAGEPIDEAPVNVPIEGNGGAKSN